ncbi:MAG: DUF4166 domain-containing protein [Micavibrio sp.]|nr:DUF4166 domain-containing protein [Micavibrio sp.]
MPSLYQRLLGERFSTLPAAVQALHDLQADIEYAGTCDVTRGSNPFCRFICALMQLPPAGQAQALRVQFRADHGREHWTRIFGTKKFYSLQYAQSELLFEKINIITLAFQVTAAPEKLSLALRQVYLLGLPVGSIFRPQVTADEYAEGDIFKVRVHVTLPLFGLLVRYAGSLAKASGG